MRHLANIRLLLVLATALAALLAPGARAIAQQGCINATNSCYEANLLAPGCSNPVCCQLACSVEPSCCEIAWDDICVAIATKFCSDCGDVNESCFVAHPTPSCSNGAVCEAVCIALPECCSIAWDEACVEFAKTLVDECGAPAAGSCLAPHDNPNCADSECCATVCTIDPRCCETVRRGARARLSPASIPARDASRCDDAICIPPISDMPWRSPCLLGRTSQQRWRL